jgi:hypothetical protein
MSTRGYRTMPMQDEVQRGKCREKTALFDKYQYAARSYAEALERLQSEMGRTARAEYDLLYDAAEGLRKEVRAAQRELEKHITEHGC